MTDISPVLNLALAYNENLAFKDIQTIHLWVNEGADIDEDVLPAMRECIQKKRGEKIGSFSYFTDAVRRRRDGRRLKEQYAKPPAPDDPEAIHRLAKMWAKTVRQFGIQDAVCISKLAAYEAKYGRVEA